MFAFSVRYAGQAGNRRRIVIKFEEVKKIYNVNNTNAFEALHSISMTIKDGEMLAVTGKSGAGKSTILHILACIGTYEEGYYYIDDVLVKDLSEKELAEIRNEKIGVVMQDYALIEDFTALENVMLSLDLFWQSGVNGRSRLQMGGLFSNKERGMEKCHDR